VAVAIGLVALGACSNDGEGDTSTPSSVPTVDTTRAPEENPPATSAESPTVNPPATSAESPIVDPTVTSPESSTAPSTLPAAVPETLAAPTTTTAPLTDADRQAASRIAAAFAALPEGWTGQPANVLNGVSSNSGMLFVAACLGPSDYDVNTLDADSAASWELAATGLPAVANAPAPTATIGARVFIDASASESAFDTLRRVLSTKEGLDCIAEHAPRQLAGFAPPGAAFTASAQRLTVEGADLGVRVSVSLVAGGAAADISVDVAATRSDDGVILFATFFSYDNPVDPEVSSALFAAAADRP